MRALFGDVAMFHNENPIGRFGLAQPMGDDEGTAAFKCSPGRRLEDRGSGGPGLGHCD